MKYDSICETGLVREINQDSVFLDSFAEYGIFCVADGMGGHENGELASQTIVSMVKAGWESMRKDLKGSGFEYVFTRLRETIERANMKIYEDYNANSVCGSTVVLLLIFDNKYGIISVGDSRVYLHYKGTVRLLTRDDVWENAPEQKGIPKEELRYSPKYGKLTKAVGTSRTVTVNTSQGEYNMNSTFLLCSDGIHKSMSSNALRYAIHTWGKHPHKLVKMLKEKVITSGARDNYSAIAVTIRGIL